MSNIRRRLGDIITQLLRRSIKACLLANDRFQARYAANSWSDQSPPRSTTASAVCRQSKLVCSSTAHVFSRGCAGQKIKPFGDHHHHAAAQNTDYHSNTRLSDILQLAGFCNNGRKVHDGSRSPPVEMHTRRYLSAHRPRYKVATPTCSIENHVY